MYLINRLHVSTWVLISVFGSTAFSGEFDSEQFWQAPGGKLALSAEMSATHFVDDSVIVNGTLPFQNKVTGQIYRPGIIAELGILTSALGDYAISAAGFFRPHIENAGVPGCRL